MQMYRTRSAVNRNQNWKGLNMAESNKKQKAVEVHDHKCERENQRRNRNLLS